MKLSDILNESLTDFRKAVENIVFLSWQHDHMSPTPFKSIMDMDEEEYDMFMDNVDHILKFAAQNRINDPQLAFDQYSDQAYPSQQMH